MKESNLKEQINQNLKLLNQSKERLERRSRKYKLIRVIEEMLKEQGQK
jgi:hypothetical protein